MDSVLMQDAMLYDQIPRSHSRQNFAPSVYPEENVGYTNLAHGDSNYMSYTPTSPQVVPYGSDAGSMSNPYTSPPLASRQSSFGSAGYTDPTFNGSLPCPGTHYMGNEYATPTFPAQSFSDMGSMLQPTNSPFFFGGDLQFSNITGIHQDALEPGFPQIQPQYNQQMFLQERMHRQQTHQRQLHEQQLQNLTDEMHSAMMLQRYWGGELPPQLKTSCPDEDRYLFNFCWQNRFKDEQEVWDSVEGDFNMAFGTAYSREELKDKLVRCRVKYIEWLPKDKELLRRAWAKMEQNRYQSLLDHFHDLGGSRNMMLSAGDIKHKVVNEMKLEEGLYVDEKAAQKEKGRLGCQNCACPNACTQSHGMNTIIWCDQYSGTA